ncbi:serine protease [Streptomyces sp. SID486]|uniref:SSI family serine proteinase inhibitor n=1 Tax=unclassified Streptomyces TaxID=2593676 RepID=UPI00136FBECD|nr:MULTISPECIES: SSI family serine proteinase inhibitor [unclassified Streptomyces]MYW21726.1 serine protease [Streptomyces sp. SID2955]MYW49777.1 serine protease [Streptomyces sp. SID161]MYY00215.1 serine protease [Streptomyces sp. SID486]
MTHITRATAAAGALLAAAGLLGAGPARAASRDVQQGSWLYLTVTRGEARSGETRGALLLCDPPRGHAHASLACGELADAGGEIDRIPAEGVFCPMIFAPVTTHARGRWNGRAVDFQETYSSVCVMKARTRHVFALDG